MDLEFVNVAWTRQRVWSLFYGLSAIDQHSGDGANDIPLVSYYQLKTYAYDNGRQEAVLDCVHLEGLVEAIPDLKERAAAVLKMHGWSDPQIGAAIGGHRTGKSLVEGAIDKIVAGQHLGH